MAEIVGRLSFNVNAEKIGDKTHFLRTLRAWRPPAVLMMNGFKPGDPLNVVVQTIETMREWGGIVIFRQFEGDAIDADVKRYRSPDDHIDWILRTWGVQDVWHYVYNEPVYYDERDQRQFGRWWYRLCKRAVSEGLRIVGPNIAAGNPANPATIAAGWWDDVLLAFIEHEHRTVRGFSQVGMAVHEYGHALLPWGAAGRDPRALARRDEIQPQHWPTADEVLRTKRAANYHILRSLWLLDRADFLAGRATTFDVHVTEAFWDRMPDLVNKHPTLAIELDSIAGEEIQGVRTLHRYWAQMFDAPPAETACRQALWAEDVYPARYRHFDIFQYVADAEDRWWKWSPHDWYEFLDLWPKMRAAHNKETPPMLPVIPPTPGTAEKVQLVPPGDFVNLRNGPGLAYPVVVRITAGTELDIYRATATTADRYTWFYARVSGRAGWVAQVSPTVFKSIGVTPEPEPEPGPEPKPPTPGAEYALGDFTVTLVLKDTTPEEGASVAGRISLEVFKSQ